MKTLAIISRKGWTGKTTIGIHLAVAAELRGLRAALFDLDPQASASSWADKRSSPSPAAGAAHRPPDETSRGPTLEVAEGVLPQLPVSGEVLGPGPAGGGQGRVARGRVAPARRLRG